MTTRSVSFPLFFLQDERIRVWIGPAFVCLYLLWHTWRQRKRAFALASASPPHMVPVTRPPRQINLLGPPPADLFGPRFQVIRRLGEGGSGVVYLATNALGHKVAIKTIHAHDSSTGIQAARLRNEAYLQHLLQHPKIVQGLGYDKTEDGMPYFVMEYVDGPSLAHALYEQGVFPYSRAIPLLLDLCQALIKSHRYGVVHRDVKTANVLLCNQRVAKLCDFGLGTWHGNQPQSHSGHTFGSIDYASPEQIRGSCIDPRSDLYSLGIILYEMLTGVLPFQRFHTQSVPVRYSRGRLLSLREKRPDMDFPLELENVILWCLQKPLHGRPQNAQTLFDALASIPCQEDMPPHSPEIQENTSKLRNSQYGFGSKLLQIDDKRKRFL